MSESEFKIDLRTGNQFWTPKGLGALGMDPYRAIAELVANSLDWRIESKDDINQLINIYIGKGFINVMDNGVGMSEKELQNAIQVSVANDTIRKSLRIRKGMFGMGMKVACLTLGWKIKIHTRSINEKGTEHYLEIDTRKLDNNDNDKSSYRNNIVGINQKITMKSPLGEWTSGTSIRVEDLTHKSINAIFLRDSLQEIFNPEIGYEKIKISVIDVELDKTYECKKTEVAIIDGSKINLDDYNLFVKDDETGKKTQIKGWIGLLKVAGAGSGKWGLHLFKNNQVIERYHQLPIKLGGLMTKNPHPTLARTYGEIHIDMCKPSFHKVGFDYSTNSWHEVQKLLEPHIGKIMDAALTYKAKDNQKKEQAIKSIQKHKKATKKAIAKVKGKKEKELDKPENAITLSDGQWFIIVEPIFENLNDTDKNKPWTYHFREKSKELAIIINKQSAVYQNYLSNESDETLELITNWAISECLMLLLISHFDFLLADALNFRNQQLAVLYKSEEE